MTTNIEEYNSSANLRFLQDAHDLEKSDRDKEDNSIGYKQFLLNPA